MHTLGVLDLLLPLVLLAGFVVAGDVVLRRAAGEIAARRLADHLSEHTSVSVDGWGGGWRVLTGRLARVVIRAEAVPAGDLELAELTVHLQGVDLPRNGRELRASSGRFSARLRAEDLAELVELPVPAMLELIDGGVRLTGPGGIGAEADLTVAEDAVVVEPRSRVLRLLPRRLRIDLGDLPGGAQVERLDVTADGIVASGPLATDRPLV